MTDKHVPLPGTALPWEATERHDFREIVGPRKGASWYGRSGVWAVAYIDTDLPEEVQDANARYIVWACNNAPALMEALEEAVEAGQRYRDGGDLDGVISFEEWLLKAEALVSLSRGES